MTISMRVTAAILLMVALVRSVLEVAFSFRTEIQIDADRARSAIDHFFAINSITVLIALSGLLLLVLSSRKALATS